MNDTEKTVGANIDDHGMESPVAHGKFSLNEDWIATISGLVILALCLVIPVVI